MRPLGLAGCAGDLTTLWSPVPWHTINSLEVVRSRCDFMTNGDLDWVLGKTMLGLLESKSVAA